MAENDIYNSKGAYERLAKNYKLLAVKPDEEFANQIGYRKYYVKNADNLVYFEKIFNIFDARDLSFIRRLRLLKQMKIICFATEKNIKDCSSEDVDKIVAFMHTVCKSPKSKRDFVTDIKHLWKNLIPDKDQFGRDDISVMPYAVRHLSAKQDKSKEKLRNDKLTLEEYEKLVESFSLDPRLQLLLHLRLRV